MSGDYGKLGHGNSVTQKLPRLILGPFTAKVSVSVSRSVLVQLFYSQ